MNLPLTCSIAGGLVWLGVLTFGVVSEQIKTRLEVNAELKDTKVICNALCIYYWAHPLLRMKME